MAITKKQCAWSECEKEFWGTERKEYCGNTCKNKQWRLNQKHNKDTNDFVKASNNGSMEFLADSRYETTTEFGSNNKGDNND